MKLLLLGLLVGGVLRGASSRDYLDYRDYQVSGTPEAITSVDVNGDGIADVVVATFGGVNVLLGDAAGKFGAPISVGSDSALSVAVGDFNGDGIPDIVATILTNGTQLTLALGNGDGTFQSPRILPNGCIDCYLAAGDFNGDGKLDLATGSTSNIAILLGDGQGNFTLSPTSYGAEFIQAMRTADLNGDGVPDLVGVDFGAGSAIVLLGRGDGTFARTDYRVGDSPFDAAFGDFNEDGAIDMAVNDRDANVIYVFLNGGGGAFGSPVKIAGGCTPYAPQGCSFEGITAGDFNRDGKIDLGTPGSVILGNGDGTFGAPVFISAGNYPQKVATIELTSREKAALLIGNGGATNFSLVPFGESGTGTHGSVAVGSQPVFAAAGDFNGDGKNDLAVAVKDSNYVRVLLGVGDGTFTQGVDLAVTGAAALVVQDFNGDRVPDIAAASTDGVWIYLGNGDGTFRLSGMYPGLPGDCTAYETDQIPAPCLAAGDINGDGIPDLVGATWGGVEVNTLLGNGDGTFRAGTSFNTAGNPFHVTLADFDHDGKLDLAVTEDFEGVFVYKGNGDGTFGHPVKALRIASSRFSAAADLNGDGNLDLIVAGGEGVSSISGDLFFVPGNGDGTFGRPVALTADGGPNAVVIADLNNDGNPDVASANYEGYDISVIAGDGKGQFFPQLLYGAGMGTCFILATDLNGDGRLDLVTANQFSSDLTIALHAGR